MLGSLFLASGVFLFFCFGCSTLFARLIVFLAHHCTFMATEGSFYRATPYDDLIIVIVLLVVTVNMLMNFYMIAKRKFAPIRAKAVGLTFLTSLGSNLWSVSMLPVNGHFKGRTSTFFTLCSIHAFWGSALGFCLFAAALIFRQHQLREIFVKHRHPKTHWLFGVLVILAPAFLWVIVATFFNVSFWDPAFDECFFDDTGIPWLYVNMLVIFIYGTTTCYYAFVLRNIRDQFNEFRSARIGSVTMFGMWFFATGVIATGFHLTLWGRMAITIASLIVTTWYFHTRCFLPIMKTFMYPKRYLREFRANFNADTEKNVNKGIGSNSALSSTNGSSSGGSSSGLSMGGFSKASFTTDAASTNGSVGSGPAAAPPLGRGPETMSSASLVTHAPRPSHGPTSAPGIGAQHSAVPGPFAGGAVPGPYAQGGAVPGPYAAAGGAVPGPYAGSAGFGAAGADGAAPGPQPARGQTQGIFTTGAADAAGMNPALARGNNPTANSATDELQRAQAASGGGFGGAAPGPAGSQPSKGTAPSHVSNLPSVHDLSSYATGAAPAAAPPPQHHPMMGMPQHAPPPTPAAPQPPSGKAPSHNAHMIPNPHDLSSFAAGPAPPGGAGLAAPKQSKRKNSRDQRKKKDPSGRDNGLSLADLEGGGAGW